MQNYQNILLAIDFSDYGQYVTERAKNLSDLLHAQLHIIHVLDNIPMPDTPYGTVISLNEDSTNFSAFSGPQGKPIEKL